MATQDRNPPQQKLVIAAFIAFGLAIFGSGGALFYLGVFKQPVLQKLTTPGYRLVYVNHIGPYNEIKDIFKAVEARLQAAKIAPGAAAAQFLDDPGTVDADQLRSKVGYLISDQERSPDELNEDRLVPQEVIQATFDGSPVIGSYKAYPAMKEWSVENHYQLNLPSFEIYYADGKVAYQLPIKAKTE